MMTLPQPKSPVIGVILDASYTVQILLCFRLLEEILLFTASSGGQLHSAGSTLVQRLLQQSMRVVYTGLAGGPSNSAKLASTTLKLLTAMVAQNVGCARDVLAVFDFSCKPLERLPVHQKGSKVCVLVGRGGMHVCAGGRRGYACVCWWAEGVCMCVHVRGGGMHVCANASAHYVGMFFRVQLYVTPVCKREERSEYSCM